MVVLAVLAAGVFGLVKARASDILFSSFPVQSTGPGDFSGVLIGGGNTNGTGLINADQFTPTRSGRLEAIQVAAETIYGDNALLVILTTDANGVPGDVLEEFFVIGQMAQNTISIVSAFSVSHPFMTAGSKYWLALSVPDLQNDAALWDISVSTAPATVATQFAAIPGTWFVGTSTSGGMETFDLIGTADTSVPEPNERWPALLAGLAVAGFSTARVRKRLAARSTRATDSLP